MFQAVQRSAALVAPQKAMAAGNGLVLFVAVHKDDIPVIQMRQVLHTRQVHGSRPYIGLRERLEDAVQRAPGFTKASHCILQVQFTTEGLAQFVTETSGADTSFAPRLSKSDETDWKVWH